MFSSAAGTHLPLMSTMYALTHSGAFITALAPSGVSLSSLSPFWFSPLGTKLQAFSKLPVFI